MARQQNIQYPTSRFPGLGGLVAAEKRREAERAERLAAARAEQIELAATYRVALRHPVELAVFDAVLERFKTAVAVEVGGRRYGAVTVATDGVTVHETVAIHFSEDSKVLDQALKGAKWAKKALVQSGEELTKRKAANNKAAQEEVSA